MVVNLYKLNNNKLYNTYTSSTIPPKQVAKANSGASKHYFRKQDAKFLSKVIKSIGPPVTLPDNNTITPQHVGHQNIPLLSPKATKTYVFDELKSSSLISLGQLCDDDCDVHLNKHNISVIKNGTTVLKGYRNHKDGLWDIDLSSTTHAPENSISQPTKYVANLIINN